MPRNPSELLASQKMHHLTGILEDEADMIIFDSPPILLITDAVELAMEADGVLLLVEAGRTRRTVVRQAVQRLKQLGVNVVGVVLNGVPLPHSKGYYYQYYGTQDKPEEGVVPSAPPVQTRQGEWLRQLASHILGGVLNRASSVNPTTTTAGTHRCKTSRSETRAQDTSGDAGLLVFKSSDHRPQ